MYPRFQLFHRMMVVSSRRLACIVHHTFFFHVPLRNSYSSHSTTFPCAEHSSCVYSAPFQITVLVRFSSVWFSLVTVLLIVCPRSLLLCPFHKKLIIWWKKSFSFCQTDNPRSSFMMYCYSTDLNVYTWVELAYQNQQVFWIQFLT